MLNKNNMRPYHAHIYFNNNESSKAAAVRVAIADAIPELTYLGHLIALPIGPHPMPMFEIHIPPAILETAIQTIDRLRDGLTVLIHPVQHDELEAHTSKAQWLGSPITLKLDVF